VRDELTISTINRLKFGGIVDPEDLDGLDAIMKGLIAYNENPGILQKYEQNFLKIFDSSAITPMTRITSETSAIAR